MTRSPLATFARAALLAVAAATFVACAEPEQVLQPDFAKGGGGGGPTVAAADPPFGRQGDAGLTVAITGSGYDQGSQASWERGGAPDPKITVRSTQFVSTSQLVATIDIAGDAVIDLYDVAVTTSGGRKGIGTELFEVTQAITIEGTSLALGVNESGQTVGQRAVGQGVAPFCWSPSTSLETLSSSGIGMDVSADGLTVVGSLGGSDPVTKTAVIWTRSGSSWTQTVLPKDPAAGASNARAVASDPVSGAAVVIGGVDIYVVRKTARREPRLWFESGGGWQRVVLPVASGMPQNDVWVHGVTAGLLAVGQHGSWAAVWEPDGLGGWTPLIVGPQLSDLHAVNSTGTLAVGRNSGGAAYWQRVGGTWTGPFSLPGTCGRATDVDDAGRILVSECDLGPGLRRSSAAIIAPPYGPAEVTFLGGFGNQTEGPQAEAISRQGTWIVGGAALKNNTILGTYWRIF